MNLNLFSRNGSESTNSTWYSTDDDDDSTEDKEAAAALQKYQQLDLIDDDEAASPALRIGNITGAGAAVIQQTSAFTNASELDRTRPLSRAERAGSEKQAMFL